MALILHLHPLSSYCHKALIALYETGLAFEPRMVNLGDPVARAAFRALWPTGKIPLLEDTDAGRVIPETSIMIEYLDRRMPEAERLIPADPEAALEVRLWDRLTDLYLHDAMQRIVGDRLRPEEARDPHGTAQARAALHAAYAMLEARLETREFLAGPRFSMADCAAAPALFYATILEPLGPGTPALARYFEALVARPSVARTIAEARPFFRYFPYGDAMPERFRHG